MQTFIGNVLNYFSLSIETYLFYRNILALKIVPIENDHQKEKKNGLVILLKRSALRSAFNKWDHLQV